MREHVVVAAVAIPFAVGVGWAVDRPNAGGDVVLTFADPDIVESSGLVVERGLAFTVNDSGDSGRVFAVDLGSGETVGETRWEPTPTDVEALAPAGDGSVWVGDTGGNIDARQQVEVLRVPVGRFERTVEPERHTLTYPDDAGDAEALLAHPRTGRLYVATKTIFGGTLYAAPERLDGGDNLLEPVGSVPSVITDGAFFPDGRHVVLRAYAKAWIYTFPELEEVASFFLPEQEQGEGLAVTADGRVLISSEGLRTDVLQLRLPPEVRRVLAPASSGPASPSPSPASPAAGSGSSGSSGGSSGDVLPGWSWALGGAAALAVLAGAVTVLRRRG